MKKPQKKDAAKKEDALMALTPQQRGFVADWLVGNMPAYQAAVKNGYSHWHAIKILQHLPSGVKEVCRQLMEASGITLEKLVKVEKGLLESKDAKIRDRSLTRLYKIFGILNDASEDPAKSGSQPGEGGDVHLHFHDHRVQDAVSKFHKDLREIYERSEEEPGGAGGGGKVGA